jgi:hypothetical protein
LRQPYHLASVGYLAAAGTTEETAETEGGEEAMSGRSILKWTAIVTNVLLIIWMVGTAYAWGSGDWLGGSIVIVPPALAIVALVQK